jgi:hypothetical protein
MEKTGVLGGFPPGGWVQMMLNFVNGVAREKGAIGNLFYYS